MSITQCEKSKNKATKMDRNAISYEKMLCLTLIFLGLVQSAHSSRIIPKTHRQILQTDDIIPFPPSQAPFPGDSTNPTTDPSINSSPAASPQTSVAYSPPFQADPASPPQPFEAASPETGLNSPQASAQNPGLNLPAGAPPVSYSESPGSFVSGPTPFPQPQPVLTPSLTGASPPASDSTSQWPDTPDVSSLSPPAPPAGDPSFIPYQAPPAATSSYQKPQAVSVQSPPSASSSPVLGTSFPNIVPAASSAGMASAKSDQKNEKSGISKGVLLTILLVPTLLGGSILLSMYVACMCNRSEYFEALNQDNTQGSGSLTSSSRRPPFAPWLWGLGTGNTQKKELARAYEYSFLQEGTNNFSSANLLGEGNSGRVYKARLDDDYFAAVKKLDIRSKQAEQGFQAEVELLSNIRHCNLVSLLGFCVFGDQRLLIYEYMQNGSLQDQLHGPSHGSALSWYLRMKIALDAARGLEHLHEHCSPLVIHRDFKSSNILIDASFNAKVSDFGLALSAPRGMRRGEIVQGTLGYVAPEYVVNGSITEKSDVYAFGVVLLELMTGRKPIQTSMPPGQQSLVSWAMPLLSDRSLIPTILDPNLQGTMNMQHLYQLAAVATLCIQGEPSYRPLIADVVLSLIPLVPTGLGGSLRVTDPLLALPDPKSFTASQASNEESMADSF